MLKPDFSDYYKFLASLGIVLLSLAIITPWLVFNTSFDTQISAVEITQLTPIAQEIINFRQSIVLWFIGHIFWLSGIIGFSGIIVLISGLLFWRQRQILLDNKENLETLMLSKEFEPLTPSQIAEKVLQQMGYQYLGEIEVSSPQFLLANYLEIQTLLFKKIQENFSSILTHRVVRNQRIRGTERDIDILVQAKTGTNVIIETRFLSQPAHADWLKENLGQAVTLAHTYESKHFKPTQSVLFIVSPQSDLLDTLKKEYQENLTQSIINSRVRPILILESELQKLTSDEILKIISPEILTEIDRQRENIRKQDTKRSDLLQKIKSPQLWMLYSRNNPVKGTLAFVDGSAYLAEFGLYSGWNVRNVSKRVLNAYPYLALRSFTVQKFDNIQVKVTFRTIDNRKGTVILSPGIPESYSDETIAQMLYSDKSW